MLELVPILLHAKKEQRWDAKLAKFDVCVAVHMFDIQYQKQYIFYMSELYIASVRLLDYVQGAWWIPRI